MKKPIFFATQALFRQWLIDNHDKQAELIVGYYKVKSGLPSMTWPQSVGHALCVGWIDGVRKSIDEDSYQIRFTPRKKESVWSQVNIDKIQKLTEDGLMQPAGIKIFKNRTENKNHGYSSKKQDLFLPINFETQFKQNKKAWIYFESLAPSYKKISINWVVTAVQTKTQVKRLQQLIEMSELGTNKWKDNKYNKKK
ncbi:MAG: YdeI/OmpD-associated family protein [Saccharospirillaceae bacterium]|nr:YdeI/OmpD-associated family protein [Pseudomonadales bacterium]NRB77990.1 YdeI/OmpD-associated family protein [Saccharospirillaceae bacterium]